MSKHTAVEAEVSNGHDGPKVDTRHDDFWREADPSRDSFWRAANDLTALVDMADPEEVPPPLPDGTAPFVKQASASIDYDVPMPAIEPSRRNKYPFAQLDKVGASFFVAQVSEMTDDKSDVRWPDMKKRLTPTVSGMNVKLRPKHFVVANVQGGARIWRDK